jgi:hypothetical protein
MKAVTIHLEMSDAAAEELTQDAQDLADRDEITRVSIDPGISYEARLLAIGFVPA